jgi:hypothetical protein
VRLELGRGAGSLRERLREFVGIIRNVSVREQWELTIVRDVSAAVDMTKGSETPATGGQAVRYPGGTVLYSEICAR